MQTQPLPHLSTGERYAGVVLDITGHIKHHLILLADRPTGHMGWQAAMAWAASVGGDLPSPQEQFLLLANCRDALPKTWCWTNKEDEEDASYAWDCHFGSGSQLSNLKSYDGSAVAVRRLALESFNPSGEPSAHVCTTLPPGNLPMRAPYSDISAPTMLALESQCGRVKQFFMRQFAAKFPPVPIGTWSINETRIDEDGEAWIKKDQGIHYVVDDFGFLVRVDGNGGAA